ncbi:MAG: T9SS type A sorting domain-containing protein [Bacteroidetes bacterium]|nr:T9SS type A sorting domain-containing protein [Bacteroidota bacterium]
MNKFIFPLAAAAALFTGNLFAQEAAFSNSQSDAAAPAYDCVKSVSGDNKTLGFQGGVVTQDFTACTTGALKEMVLTVKNATEGAVYLAELVNGRGDVIDMTRFSKSDFIEETLTLNLNAPVKEGKRYTLQITAPEGQPLALRYLQGPMGTLWKNGDPVRGQLTATIGFKSHDLADVNALDKGRGETGPQNRAMEGQCRVAVNGHDGRLPLSAMSHRIMQNFTACSKGVLEHINVKVLTSYPDFMGRFTIRTAEGEELYTQNISARNIENGTLSLPLNIRVEQGEQLVIGIKNDYDTRIAFHANSEGNVGTCKLNGSPKNTNLEFTAYIAEVDDAPARAELVETKVTTYPNPFADRISVRLENAKDGKAIVQLLDFSGNVLRSDLIFVKNAEGDITFETRDIERPGYYALRVIQGDDVKNITIMKR